MSTPQQVQTMLDLMAQQMTQLTALATQNQTLRTKAVTPTTPTPIVAPLVPGGGNTRSRRPDRPAIEANIDDREWSLFLDTWSRYKTMVGLVTADDIRLELRAACSSEVNKLLFEFVGPHTLNVTDEEMLLGHIKSVAVRTVHKEVHRLKFVKMTQSDGETITHFVARLKSQAALCQFTVKCETCDHAPQISYADDMVAQQMVAGPPSESTFGSCYPCYTRFEGEPTHLPRKHRGIGHNAPSGPNTTRSGNAYPVQLQKNRSNSTQKGRPRESVNPGQGSAM